MKNNPNYFPKEDGHALIQGPAGFIEIATTQPAELACNLTVIIAHPHPQFGGTMENKVVTTLMRTFRDMGLRVVRFNFRGIGKSEGTFDDARGEVDDLKAVLSWVTSVLPQDTLWLSGFSFGAYVAAKVANERNDIKQLITIAPAVTRYEFDSITSVACPWLLVQGDEDEVIAPQVVFQWAQKSPLPIEVIKMEGAGHFFHGRLVELKEILKNHLSIHSEHCE